MSESKVIDEMSPYPPKEIPEWKKKPVRTVRVMVCAGCRARGVTLHTVKSKHGDFLFCKHCIDNRVSVQKFLAQFEQRNESNA